MSLSLDKAFGILPAAVKVQARREELLASNMANVDTPDYKSRDFDFHEVLAKMQGDDDLLPLSLTQPSHIPLPPPMDEDSHPELLYRIPAQPALDGNTVDPQFERAAFAENTMFFQSSLEFLDRRVSGLRAALRKE